MTLDQKTLSEFSEQINWAHQRFCIFIFLNNELSKHEENWNKEMSKVEGYHGNHPKYKNFWKVVHGSLIECWISNLARILDPAYYQGNKKRPRLSLNYINDSLGDQTISGLIKEFQKHHKWAITWIKKERDNSLAHYTPSDGIPNNKSIKTLNIQALFEALESILRQIETLHPDLKDPDGWRMELKYTKKLSQCGVEEVSEMLC